MARFDNKKRLIQLIHIAKSQLRLDGDTYKQALFNVTGKESTTEMTGPQLQAVLDHFKMLGFKVEAKSIKQKTGVSKLASDNQSKLIRHIWLRLHSEGVVRNADERALAAYVERVTKVSALQFLTSDMASTVIESLKKMCKRNGIKLDEPVVGV